MKNENGKISLGWILFIFVIIALIIAEVYLTNFYKKRNTEIIKNTVNQNVINVATNNVVNEEELMESKAEEIIKNYFDWMGKRTEGDKKSALKSLGFPEVNILDETTGKTDISYEDFKNKMLEMYSEKFIEENFASYDNKDGVLYATYDGGTGATWTVESVEKNSFGNYIAKVKYECCNGENETINFRVIALEKNGNYIIDSVVAEDKEINETNIRNINFLDKNNSSGTEGEYILLYEGSKIIKKAGVQVWDAEGMMLNENEINNYKIKYYNYENGEYKGECIGNVQEGVFDGSYYVDNVSKFATSMNYNLYPAKYNFVNIIPSELEDFVNCTSFDMINVDLDKDGQDEHIVISTFDERESNSNKKTISGQDYYDTKYPDGRSKVQLYDSNYNKVADLVELVDTLVYDNNLNTITKKKIDFVDIDNDGKSEIFIDIPQYECNILSICKYEDGKVIGESNLKLNLNP